MRRLEGAVAIVDHRLHHAMLARPPELSQLGRHPSNWIPDVSCPGGATVHRSLGCRGDRPLVALQARELNEAGMRRLIHDLSASSENPKDLGAVFDAMWPQLEAAVTEAINAAPPETEPRRSAEDMLDELVERVRRLDRRTEDQEQPTLLFKKTGEVVFTLEDVEQGLGSKRTYPQGTSGLITHVHVGPGDQVTHVDVRLPDGQFVRKVPVDYFTA
jgi:hypothetical protein